MTFFVTKGMRGYTAEESAEFLDGMFCNGSGGGSGGGSNTNTVANPNPVVSGQVFAGSTGLNLDQGTKDQLQPYMKAAQNAINPNQNGLQNYGYNAGYQALGSGLGAGQQALGFASQVQGNMGNGYANISGAPNLNQTDLSGYMNPYTQNVINTTNDQINRSYDMQGQALSGQAARAGAFGGDRAAIQQAENDRNRASQIAQTDAGLYQSNFGNAQSQAQVDLARQQQTQMANQQNMQANVQSGLSASNLQNATGANMMGLANSAEGLGGSYAAYPLQNLSAAANVAYSNPLTKLTTTNSNQGTSYNYNYPSSWTANVGAGLAGASLLDQLGAFDAFSSGQGASSGFGVSSVAANHPYITNGNFSTTSPSDYAAQQAAAAQASNNQFYNWNNTTDTSAHGGRVGHADGGRAGYYGGGTTYSDFAPNGHDDGGYYYQPRQGQGLGGFAPLGQQAIGGIGGNGSLPVPVMQSPGPPTSNGGNQGSTSHGPAPAPRSGGAPNPLFGIAGQKLIPAMIDKVGDTAVGRGISDAYHYVVNGFSPYDSKGVGSLTKADITGSNGEMVPVGQNPGNVPYQAMPQMQPGGATGVPTGPVQTLPGAPAPGAPTPLYNPVSTSGVPQTLTSPTAPATGAPTPLAPPAGEAPMGGGIGSGGAGSTGVNGMNGGHGGGLSSYPGASADMQTDVVASSEKGIAGVDSGPGGMAGSGGGVGEGGSGGGLGSLGGADASASLPSADLSSSALSVGADGGMEGAAGAAGEAGAEAASSAALEDAAIMAGTDAALAAGSEVAIDAGLETAAEMAPLMLAKRGGRIGFAGGGNTGGLGMPSYALDGLAGGSMNDPAKGDHSNSGMQLPGQIIGAGIGGFFGGPGGAMAGSQAGANAGQTVGDLFGGNMKGLGADVSANLPPGMQASGTAGLINGATGTPIGNLFAHGGRAGYAGGGIAMPTMGPNVNMGSMGNLSSAGGNGAGGGIGLGGGGIGDLSSAVKNELQDAGVTAAMNSASQNNARGGRAGYADGGAVDDDAYQKAYGYANPYSSNSPYKFNSYMVPITQQSLDSNSNTYRAAPIGVTANAAYLAGNDSVGSLYARGGRAGYATGSSGVDPDAPGYALAMPTGGQLLEMQNAQTARDANSQPGQGYPVFDVIQGAASDAYHWLGRGAGAHAAPASSAGLGSIPPTPATRVDEAPAYGDVQPGFPPATVPPAGLPSATTYAGSSTPETDGPLPSASGPSDETSPGAPTVMAPGAKPAVPPAHAAPLDPTYGTSPGGPRQLHPSGIAAVHPAYQQTLQQAQGAVQQVQEQTGAQTPSGIIGEANKQGAPSWSNPLMVLGLGLMAARTGNALANIGQAGQNTLNYMNEAQRYQQQMAFNQQRQKVQKDMAAAAMKRADALEDLNTHHSGLMDQQANYWGARARTPYAPQRNGSYVDARNLTTARQAISDQIKAMDNTPSSQRGADFAAKRKELVDHLGIITQRAMGNGSQSTTQQPASQPPVPGARMGKDPQGNPGWYVKNADGSVSKVQQ